MATVDSLTVAHLWPGSIVNFADFSSIFDDRKVVKHEPTKEYSTKNNVLPSVLVVIKKVDGKINSFFKCPKKVDRTFLTPLINI